MNRKVAVGDRTAEHLKHGLARVRETELAQSQIFRVHGREWLRVGGLAFCLSFFGVVVADSSPPTDGEGRPTVIVVAGAAGEEEFGKNFEKWTGLWEKAGREAGARLVTIGTGPTNSATDLAGLKQALADEPRESAEDLWLVLLGHGTFDGKEARFNLRGPDLSATELGEWLKPFRRRLAIINASSSSGPFINALSSPGRVIVTATRSGHEQNYARFGQYLSEAIADPKADLDKDGQTSLLEAFLAASRGVTEFYEAEGRLATEHALLDDSGDRLGTPADWFRGIRAVKKAADNATPDGLRAHQLHLIRSRSEQDLPATVRARRDKLELAIAELREAKSRMDVEIYYRQLEEFLVELGKLYESQPAKP